MEIPTMFGAMGADYMEAFQPVNGGFSVNMKTRTQKIKVDNSGNIIRGDDIIEKIIEEKVEYPQIILDTKELVKIHTQMKTRLQEIRERINEIKKIKDEIEKKDTEVTNSVNHLINFFCEKQYIELESIQKMRIAYDNFERSYRNKLIDKIHSLDLEIGYLVKENKEITEKKKEIDNVFRKALEDGLIDREKIQYTQQKNTCGICLTNQVNKVFVPCGHVICGGCQQNIGANCFICRTRVEQTIPLYLNTAGEEIEEINIQVREEENRNQGGYQQFVNALQN